MTRKSIVSQLRVPPAPGSIEKGASLKDLLGEQAIDCLAANIALVHPRFEQKSFRQTAVEGIEPLGIMERGPHIARALRLFLPSRFDKAVRILLDSLTPPLAQTEGNGLAVFFYHPHTSFVAEFGLDPLHNADHDPFETSMQALHALTQRFTAEFAIRPFLIQQEQRTLAQVARWLTDASPHVRRLCSEGTRSRLPWGKRIPAFIARPQSTLPILTALKNDPSLYVRRSVANHLGDIAKDHLDFMLDVCEQWLLDASPEVKWLLRHALRHPAKQGNRTALRLRTAAS